MRTAEEKLTERRAYLRKKGYGTWINKCSFKELEKYARLELHKACGGGWLE